MKVRKIISKSKNGNRMEVIGEDDNGLHTLHINKKGGVWNYVADKTDGGAKLLGVMKV